MLYRSIVLMVALLWHFGTAIAADNPNPPTSPVKLIFIHHSTGGNWLADPTDGSPYGGLGTALMANNYYVSATNYGWGPDSIGDRTDIVNWPEWFTGPNHIEIMNALYAETGQNVQDFGEWTRMASDPGGPNQIVLFKSCFPNSNLTGNPSDPAYSEPNDWEYSVANAKAVYNNLLKYFATRQDKLFVVITAPPLNANEYPDDNQTPAARAANARAFNNWLVQNWLSGYAHPNVAVFDYFNVLTSNGGSSEINDAGKSTGNHHRWWNGAVQHVQSVNNNFPAYPSGDSHPSTAGHQKATTEFLPLLNVFYHRWKAGAVVPELSVSPASQTIPHNTGSCSVVVFNTGTGAMAWTAAVQSGAEWLRITSGSAGTDYGTIGCEFSANTGSTLRTGVIRVTAPGAKGSPVDVTFTQAAACTATLDNNMNLQVPLISLVNSWPGAPSFRADLLYEFLGVYPSLVLFRLTDVGLVQKETFPCTGSTLSDDLTIHIPDVILSDGKTRLWADLSYFPSVSSEESAYFVVTKAGVFDNEQN
jgi:hypothetical protein